jgi:hypothetical protein
VTSQSFIAYTQRYQKHRWCLQTTNTGWRKPVCVL